LPKVSDIIQLPIFVDECVVEGKSIKEAYGSSALKRLSRSMHKKIKGSKGLKNYFDSLKKKEGLDGITYEQFVSTLEKGFDHYALKRARKYALDQNLYADSEQIRVGKELVEQEKAQGLIENPMKAISVINESREKTKTACEALLQNHTVQDVIGEYGNKVLKNQIENMGQMLLFNLVEDIEQGLKAKAKQAA